VKLYAHRGLSARFPENTVASFRAAREEGCRAAELDVQLTADGVAVVFHDDDLVRLAASPVRVDEAVFAAVRLFGVGGHLAPRFAAERIPTLDEALAAWGGAGEMNVELKGVPAARREALAAAVAAVLARRPGSYTVSSFDWALLRAYRRHDARTSAGVLFERGRWADATAAARELGAAALNCDVRSALPEAVAAARAAGYEVNVYTVNDAALARRLAAIGVTGLFTDDEPRLARELERA
jgi:glycerophosphoryl diester phosphodiesterase